MINLQWTLAYRNSSYANTRIIRTSHFNDYVIKNYIIALCTNLIGLCMNSGLHNNEAKACLSVAAKQFNEQLHANEVRLSIVFHIK